jgi:hypothetical protein
LTLRGGVQISGYERGRTIGTKRDVLDVVVDWVDFAVCCWACNRIRKISANIALLLFVSGCSVGSSTV